ncbi:MAG: metallophosphoesterase family protein [Candidatus Kariarchaeaceae archaeon]|jgi:3',5'-cyclic AMP phosphodiesterase CpdA
MKFVIMSDSHIGGRFSELPLIRGIKLINDMEDVDYLIHCGDLTENGTIENYKLANKYLNNLEKELLIVPGNHDAGNVGYLLFEELIGPRYFIISDPKKKVKILGMDSSIPDTAHGRIGYSGIQTIYREFRNIEPDWLTVIVFHHHALPIPFTGRERSAIFDAGDVIKAILDCNINLVLNGHRHISNVYRLNNGKYVQSLIVNSGTICSKKTRYREQFSLTEVEFDENRDNAKVKIIDISDEVPHEIIKYDGSITQSIKTVGATVQKEQFVRGRIIGKIIHISKTQFSISMLANEIYDRGVRIINNMDCNVIVHCGDVTDDSQLEEFKMAGLKLTQMVDIPQVIVPGTRDTFSLGWELFDEFITDSEYFHGNLDWTKWSNDCLEIIGLNSCLLEEKEGRIGRNKTKLIIDEINTSEKFPIIALHHTLIPLDRTKHEAELTDAGDVLSAVTKANIPLVLTGSKYKAGAWQVDDTVIVNAGPFSSKKITNRKGNSFNNIIIYESEDGMNYIIEIYEVLISTNKVEQLGRFLVKKLKDRNCKENNEN